MTRTTSGLIVLALVTCGGCETGTPTVPSGEPITEISQRYQGISAFGVTLRADGTATKLCILPADGNYTVAGRIEPADFRALVAYVEREGFFALEPHYGEMGAFSPSITSAVRGGTRYQVRSDLRSEPAALRRIREVLDRAGDRVPCGVPPR
jgi:hypothetical protein